MELRTALSPLTSAGALSGRPEGWALTLARSASGVIFVVFGAGKFVNHASETSSFRTYGLPSPGLFADVIGVLELVGGAMLIIGFGTRLAAVVLAGDMVGAIVTSGLMHGESVSLTLAPTLLVVCLALALLGPGQLSLDARRGRASGSEP